MARAFVAGSLFAALVPVAAVDQSAAQVRNAYFSNGEVSGTQRYRDEAELPGPTQEFVKIGSTPNMSWRVWTWAFLTDRLDPGDYSFDLVVDGHPGGTYGFTLRCGLRERLRV